jgi:hypothetical protein
MSIIGTILVGFIVGLIARALKPGNDRMGLILTTLLGIARRLRRPLPGPGDGPVHGQRAGRLDRVGDRRGDPAVRRSRWCAGAAATDPPRDAPVRVASRSGAAQRPASSSSRVRSASRRAASAKSSPPTHRGWRARN